MALCPHHWKIEGVSLDSKLWTAKILAEQPELIKQVHKNYFKAGADIILFETVPSLKEAKVEAEIAEEYGYDYWISFSCLSENIICEGTPIAECATTFAKGYPHLKMIGVNCTKPEYIIGLIHKIKENCDIPIGVYPNSGEEYDAVKKVWFGKQSALSFEQYAYNYMKSGASAVGGCCTTVAKYSVRIYAGDQLIYQYSDSNFHRNDQMKSKLSCDARIPEQGKKGTVIKIIYQNGSNGIYDLDDILVGRGDVVMGFHVQQEIVGIVMIAIMFFLSFVALTTGIYLKHFKLNSTRFLNIAAFLALSGIWFLSDSALAQEYTSFPALTGMISFYAFMLMSVPMVHFVKNTLKFEKYKVLDVINLLFYANALIQGILNKCLKIHMVHMLFVTHVLLFIAVITIVVLMIEEYRRTKDSELKIIMNAFGIMAVAGVLSLCMYWKLEIPFYGTIFEVGVLIFEQLLLTSIFVNLVEQAKTRSELEVYERLLKEDRMTGINNRTAFEEQLQDIEDHAQDYDNAALIFMDVDGLKNTNDLYGHNAGDELIISAALCIKNVFATYGKCYRIGGDEFGVLIFDSIENMDELLKQMDQEIIKYNRNNRYYLSIARGVSFLKDTEGKQKKISDWKYEADQDMYCNKKRRNINDRL